MKKKHKWEGLKLETPGKYRIRVQGRIDDHWAERLGGMAISYDTFDDQPTVGALVGTLPDQAALSGVLNTLYDLRLPLLSVENLDEKTGPSDSISTEPPRDPFKAGAHNPSTC